MKKQLIIADDSCNGEEMAFEKWMNKNFPEIETSIENTLCGGYFEDDERIEDENFWNQFCGS